MEERLPASDDALPLETYVVQVPRDQIYRVPPPEHALKLEELKRNSESHDSNGRTLICSLLTPLIAIAIVASIGILTVRYTLYSPTTPEFAVVGIQGKGLSGRDPEFRVMIRAKNRNTRMSVAYKGSGSGESTLVFKDTKIGVGKMRGGRGDLVAVLAGNVSPEMNKSLSEEREKSMDLESKVRVEMKSWVRDVVMDVTISCDFRVRNSLMNVTEISYQECKEL